MMRSTIEGDMDKRKCPKCEEVELHMLLKPGNKIHYYCYKCEHVFIFDEDKGEFI